MGWLQRLFGLEKPKANTTSETKPQASSAQASPSQAAASTETESIPPERMGLNGEYDQNGLAKRVALAFDNNGEFDDIETIYVAQTGTTVVLKGKAPSQQIIDKMVSVARNVKGATHVDTSQVTTG